MCLIQSNGFTTYHFGSTNRHAAKFNAGKTMDSLVGNKLTVYGVAQTGLAAAHYYMPMKRTGSLQTTIDNGTQHKKASNHHANLPLEMYSFTL